MNNYVKVAFSEISGADSNFRYMVDQVTEAPYWFPEKSDAKSMGGFSFATEETLLRWLIRGDTLYDVVIPEDAEMIAIDNPSTPGGVFRTNKIILTNPRFITDDMAMDLYNKSKMPEKTYYKSLAGLAIRGYINTAKQLIKDKITKNNVDLVLSEFEDFVRPENCSVKGNKEVYEEILNELYKIKKGYEL